MTTAQQIPGTLRITISSQAQESNWIPKQIEILGADLSLKHAEWIEQGYWEGGAPVGVYVVRLNLSSGTRLEEVVEVVTEQTTEVNFDMGQQIADESQEWRYFTKRNAPAKPHAADFRSTGSALPSFFQHVFARRWYFYNQQWSSQPEPAIQDAFIAVDGSTFHIDADKTAQLLELIVPNKPSIFVGLPPGHWVKCIVSAAESRPFNHAVLDVSITTENQTTQSLLSLIAAGDIGRAKSLMSEEDAERLLFQKMTDPASAAVGGYYLLKTGALERMHDWAKNLANLFPWLADGAIIHAWQLIQQQGDTNLIKKRLLEAIERGLPVYTEGLRLLYEGINMLAFEFEKKDNEVNRAARRIRAYVNAADMSQDTITFIGKSPDQPGFYDALEQGPNVPMPQEPISI